MLLIKCNYLAIERETSLPCKSHIIFFFISLSIVCNIAKEKIKMMWVNVMFNSVGFSSGTISFSFCVLFFLVCDLILMALKKNWAKSSHKCRQLMHEGFIFSSTLLLHVFQWTLIAVSCVWLMFCRATKRVTFKLFLVSGLWMWVDWWDRGGLGR